MNKTTTVNNYLLKKMNSPNNNPFLKMYPKDKSYFDNFSINIKNDSISLALLILGLTHAEYNSFSKEDLNKFFRLSDTKQRLACNILIYYKKNNFEDDDDTFTKAIFMPDDDNFNITFIPENNASNL
jgi:hypothetical protein